MTMIERVARALAGRDDAYESKPAIWNERARTAIAAMREPTAEMVASVPYDMYEPDFAENWRTMIDAALRT